MGGIFSFFTEKERVSYGSQSPSTASPYGYGYENGTNRRVASVYGNANYPFRPNYSRQHEQSAYEIFPIQIATRTELQLEQLDEYEIPHSVKVLYANEFKCKGTYGPAEIALLDEFEQSRKVSSLTPATYRRQLTLLNQIEDEHLQQEFRNWFVMNPRLVVMAVNRYSLTTNQFKHRQAVKAEMMVRFSIASDFRTLEFMGTVDEVDNTIIEVIAEEEIPLEQITKIEFFSARTTFQLEYRAMNMVDDPIIAERLFPTKFVGKPSEAFSRSQLSVESMACNKEQMEAAQNIINQTSFPAPYILFGPPGTGKTSTLVKTIGQIFKLRPNTNILVSATSNFAANELTSRLIDVVSGENIFRFFSKSNVRKVREIDKQVLGVSNLKGGNYKKLCYEDIFQHRVIVCTLTIAGRLTQATRIPKDHFSYIFVDECGSAKEVSALVPIAGFERNSMVVLAGDPKQLGPVMQYELLNQTNHSISMLERKMNLDLYKKSPTTGTYNSLVITKLRDNYRSHEKLLYFSNTMFYDGQLRAKASQEISDWATGWHQLPNRGFPLIFHPVVGEIRQDKNSSSMYNEQEAERVICYVQDILEKGINGKKIAQSNIGIISPYARQVVYLKKLFKQLNWKDIEIGSTEQYQGREKDIIIITTVRSRCSHVGFLGNVKRLNVALTRARALMVIIGDPATLERNKHWKQFIAYCRNNQAIVGSVRNRVPRQYPRI